MKRLLCSLVLTPGWLLPAYAGDFAERNVIGFSPDGAYFAFEEYGIQDGSGFPYSNVYVIDVKADEWVPGSPFRITLQDDGVSVNDARGLAVKASRDMLERLEILRGTDIHTGQTVLTRHYTDLAEFPYELRFNPRIVVPPIDEPYRITTDIYKVEDNPDCYDTGEAKGYRLTLQKEGGEPVVLHEDGESVPDSRACARDYRVHDVITFYPSGGEPVIAVLVQYLRTGFEGPDARFIAVTAPLPQ